jgi:pimeloyl-ACP methyl ester carboxylesterase
MITQQWIRLRKSRLLTTEHWPDEFAPAARVVLLPGFSHPMCDADYMMSKLARRLSERHFAVTQVDLRGHGDSPYPFDEVDLDMLREDVEALSRHYRTDYFDRTFFIGRGLTATLIAECARGSHIAGIGGIAPYCLVPEFAAQFSSESPKDAWDIFPGNDYINHSDFDENACCMLNALGAVDYNLHGMRISQKLMAGLAEFDARAALEKTASRNSCWIFCNPSEERPAVWRNETFPKTEFFREPPLPRDPKTQHEVIGLLGSWLTDTYLN